MRYKISQYAKLINRHYRTVWNQVKAGKLPYEKTPEGSIYILVDDTPVQSVSSAFVQVSTADSVDNLREQAVTLVQHCVDKGLKITRIYCEVEGK